MRHGRDQWPGSNIEVIQAGITRHGRADQSRVQLMIEQEGELIADIMLLNDNLHIRLDPAVPAGQACKRRIEDRRAHIPQLELTAEPFPQAACPRHQFLVVADGDPGGLSQTPSLRAQDHMAPVTDKQRHTEVRFQHPDLTA